jgi:hypothetical protein
MRGLDFAQHECKSPIGQEGIKSLRRLGKAGGNVFATGIHHLG